MANGAGLASRPVRCALRGSVRMRTRPHIDRTLSVSVTVSLALSHRSSRHHGASSQRWRDPPVIRL
jgi:hypothetical protein